MLALWRWYIVRPVYQLKIDSLMRSPMLKSAAGTLFEEDARLVPWDISTRRSERSEMQGSDHSWPQELGEMPLMLGRMAIMVALIILEQRTAGQEDVNAARCHRCPNSVEDIPPRYTLKL